MGRPQFTKYVTFSFWRVQLHFFFTILKIFKWCVERRQDFLAPRKALNVGLLNGTHRSYNAGVYCQVNSEFSHIEKLLVFLWQVFI